MAQNPQVTVEPRTATGKGPIGRLRRAGKIPCVLYGRGVENENLQIGEDDASVLAHAHGLLMLQYAGGETKPVMVRDAQYDHLKGDLLHVDFQVVRMDETITNTIPLVPTGEAIGISHGGVVEQLLHEIELECLPQDMPEQIEVDISKLDVDVAITISQVLLPENVTALFTDPEQPVFTCSIPRAEEEEGEAPEGEAMLEPEVIEKGKKAEEEEEE